MQKQYLEKVRCFIGRRRGDQNVVTEGHLWRCALCNLFFDDHYEAKLHLKQSSHLNKLSFQQP